MIEHPDDALLDPRAEYERLLAPCVCDWCGKAVVEQDAKTGIERLVPLQPIWQCREVKQNGYVSKHWKAWRVCKMCLLPASFAKWVFPAIANMAGDQNFIEQLVAVQPMAAPAPQIMYMDIVVGPRGAEVRREGVFDENPCGEQELRLQRAYAERPLNPALYGREVVNL